MTKNNINVAGTLLPWVFLGKDRVTVPCMAVAGDREPELQRNCNQIRGRSVIGLVDLVKEKGLELFVTTSQSLP